VRWGDRGRPGPPGGVGEPRVPWAACGSAVLVRIRLARVFGKLGRLSNLRSLRAPSSGRTNRRRTMTGARQARRVRPFAGISSRRSNAWRSAPAGSPGDPPPRNHSPHPAPGPDPRNLKPAAEARPPAGARRGGASYASASISTQKSPHPPRETGAWASYASRRIAPPASSGCFVVVDRGPNPEPTGDAPVLLWGHRASTERNGRAVAAMRSQRRARREPGAAIVSRAVPS
jgi:hypothetical protein